MTLLSLLGRIMRYFLLRPETLFLLCISLALWSYFFHTDEVKTIVKSSRDAVKMVKGKVAEMMQNERFGGLDVLDAEFSKTWEFKTHNVAVYSIQGRRDHMEDRFEVLADTVNKTHPSIFGVFDGHGGEVSGCVKMDQSVKKKDVFWPTFPNSKRLSGTPVVLLGHRLGDFESVLHIKLLKCMFVLHPVCRNQSLLALSIAKQSQTGKKIKVGM